jgi:hypothetical protein
VLTFVVDGCVSRQTLNLLKSLGFTVERIQDLAGPGIEDQEVFRIAQESCAGNKQAMPAMNTNSFKRLTTRSKCVTNLTQFKRRQTVSREYVSIR